MDSYFFSTTSDNGSKIPIASDPTTSITVIPELVVGDPDSTTSPGYLFPSVIGNTGQVLVVPPTSPANASQLLQWAAQSGTGGSGFQSGPVNIGSINNVLTLRGNQGISIIGGIEYQYDSVTYAGGENLTLTDIHYFVEIKGSGNNTVTLPFATKTGQQFIISKGYANDILTITTQTADKIDGDDSLLLTVQDQRIKLISSGDNRWMVI